MAAKPMRVLIVDDEVPLRQELRLFPWESCGAVLIGEAGNGEEALQLCGVCAPDVVVTDITMPIMDGITLIRELRQRYPAIQIILLTCHSDFHYVQEALRLGALEYLLKVSMEEEEMKKALIKVSEAIDKERRSRENKKSERRLLQAAAFGKLLHGHELNGAEWKYIEPDKEIPYLLARLIVDAPDAACISARQRMQQTLNDREGSDSKWLTWLSTGEKEYFILVAARQADTHEVESISEAVQELAGIMKEYAEPHEPLVTVHAIVSEPVSSKDELTYALAFTTEWKDALFYDGSPESGVLIGSPLPLKKITDKHAKEMNELLRMASRSTALLKSCLQEDFAAWCVEKRIRPQQLKQRMLNWQMEWLKVHEGAELDSRAITQLMEAKTLQQLTACLVHNIAVTESGVSSTRIEIRSAIQWIQENMKQPISLPIIAEQVGLSPHYVSRLFREETGDTVNQYITKVRMEKAVELLKRTNKKVYEIAEEVGIPSYRYFTVTFRNWTGVSPTDYKRNP